MHPDKKDSAWSSNRCLNRLEKFRIGRNAPFTTSHTIKEYRKMHFLPPKGQEPHVFELTRTSHGGKVGDSKFYSPRQTDMNFVYHNILNNHVDNFNLILALIKFQTPNKVDELIVNLMPS
jgi:hypothetical protein